MKLYIDGLQVASVSAGSIFYGAGGIAIGRDGDYSGSYFKGLVDDVRIYNKDLSAQEVVDLYNQLSGLVSHWKFDEGIGTIANDWVGGNHGIINGGVWTTGKSGGALSFDGMDDSVQIPGLLGKPQNITISAWVNLAERDTAGAEVISLGDYVAIRLDGTGGKGVMGFYYDGTRWRNTSAGTLITGTGWHHIVYVVDNTKKIQEVYIDGVQKESTEYTQLISYAGLGSNTFIGRHANGVGTYDFNGVIDDVRVYNRVLGAQEIQDLYTTFTTSGIVELDSSLSNIHDDRGLNNASVPVSPAAILGSFSAGVESDGGITLAWETVREDNVAGFNLYRSRRRNSTYMQVNDAPIKAQGNTVSGARYSLVDIPPRRGTYYYKLEAIGKNGVTGIHGPVKVKTRSGDNADSWQE